MEKTSANTINSVYYKLLQVRVQDVEHLNLFENSEILTFDSILWTWSRGTLQRFIKFIRLLYGDRINHYENTKSRAENVSMRDNYLDWISKHRAERHRIYYQEETLSFKNMSCNRNWKDIQGNSSENCYAVPSGRWERKLVSHSCCSEIRIFDDCLLIIRGIKPNNSSDYHTERNWDVFSHWCNKKVFLDMKRVKINSALVLSYATYPTVLDEKTCEMSVHGTRIEIVMI